VDGAVIGDFLALLDEQTAVRVATSVGNFVRSRLARVVVSTAVDSVLLLLALQPCRCLLTDRKALLGRVAPIDDESAEDSAHSVCSTRLSPFRPRPTLYINSLI
jgi:hypothetical protein